MLKTQPKKSVKLAIVMPLGPNDHLIDTVKSIQAYTSPSRVIIVVDDTKKTETPETLQKLGKDVHVIKADNYPGGWGGLYIKIAQGYRYAYENFNFEVMLRIDADALVIGKNPEDDAIQYFAEYPNVGKIGSYKFDCNGNKRDFSVPAHGMKRESGFILGFYRPAVRRALRKALKPALSNGYEYAEHCLGGAYFHSADCVKLLYEQGWLTETGVAKSKLGEDQLFSLFTRATGYELGDFATGGYPLGISWIGLPCSPEELIKRKKKITHSVRSWKDMDETAIRSFFAKQRAKS